MQNKITFEKVKDDFEKRGYELISSEYKNTKTPLTYICKAHYDKGKQHIDYDHFRRKQGCVYCAYEQGRQVHQIPEDICKEQVEENGYIYVGLERKNEKTSVSFICPKHKEKGIQQAYWISFKKKHTSCGYCNGTRRSTEDFQKMVNKMSPNVKITEEYTGARNYIGCKCLFDGTEWRTRAFHLLTGYGCPECGKRITGQKKRTSKEQKLEKLLRIRPDIKILSVPETAFGYTKCQCPKCGEIWEATYSNLTNPSLLTGCPRCNQSKGELEVEKILKKYNIVYETQKIFDDCRDIRPLPFDFYIPNKNTIIEYDGEFHYEVISFGKYEPQNVSIDRLNKTKAHDKIKDNYCVKNKINLIRIPYWEKSNIENIIVKEII